MRAELAEITARVQDAIRQRGQELSNIPGVITVRPGYRSTDGTISNDPVGAAAWWKQNASIVKSSATSPSNQGRGSNHD